MSKLTIFDYLNAITLKNDIDFSVEENRRAYAPFMINRFISMCDMYILLANEINKYDVPKNVHFEFYKNALPKRKQFFKYIKKSKDVDAETKEMIAKYFECGKRDAELYSTLLDEDVIETLKRKFDDGRTK